MFFKMAVKAINSALLTPTLLRSVKGLYPSSEGQLHSLE